MSNEFRAGREELESLQCCLSRDRLSKYLRATQGSLSNALALYNWNTAISAAFYGPLQWLEVTLRNSVDNCLAEVYGDAWYFHNDARLDFICRRQVKEARDRLERNNQAITRSRMVAALSFGFWVTLLSRGGMLRLRYTVSFGLDSLDAGSGGLGLAGVGWEEAEQGRSSDSMR